jgi:hypothetical protein
MGQFKPMVKMETTEPSVILKLKKGGHVASEQNDADGHTNMKGKSFMSARAAEAAEDGCAPKKPSMTERRKAMSGAMLNSKKGGKVDKKAMGGMMGAPMGGMMDPRKAAMLRAMKARGARPAIAGALPAAPAMGGMPAMKKGGKTSDTAEDKAMIKKAFKQHDAQEHMGSKGTSLALKTGGVMKSAKPGNYATGGVVNGQGGFKEGGIIMSKKGSTKMSTAKADTNSAPTGDVKLGNGGGYKKGGEVTSCWENRPANTSKPGVTNTVTGEVRKANAGGFKKGGATKKHFATGGSVNNAGRAVAMPERPVSKPVSNTAQSGTFKKGGKVGKFAGGGSEDAMPQSASSMTRDMTKGAYDATTRDKYADDMDVANTIRNAPSTAYSAIKKLLGIKPEAGAGRGFINPPMARKRGGSAC